MTGDQIKQIRDTLGLSTQQFADLLGVHVSSVFRWEGSDSPTVEDSNLKLLRLIDAVMKRYPSEKQHAQIKDRILDGLALGGTLRALYVVLHLHFSSAAP